MRPSMGTVGDAYDNAMCESFFATLECELLGACDESRGAHGHLRVHRGLVQPDTAPFRTRSPLADRVRAASFNESRARGYPQAARSVAIEAPRAQPVDNRL